MREQLSIELVGSQINVPIELDEKFPVGKVLSWLSHYNIEVKKLNQLDMAIDEMSRLLARSEDNFVLIQADGLKAEKATGWIGLNQFKPELLVDAFAQQRIDDLFIYDPGRDQFISAQSEEYDYWIITKTSEDYFAFKNL